MGMAYHAILVVVRGQLSEVYADFHHVDPGGKLRLLGLVASTLFTKQSRQTQKTTLESILCCSHC